MKLIRIALLVVTMVVQSANADGGSNVKESCQMDLAFGALSQMVGMDFKALKNTFFSRCPAMAATSARIAEIGLYLPVVQDTQSMLEVLGKIASLLQLLASAWYECAADMFSFQSLDEK